MGKRKLLLASLWVGCFCVCLPLLAGCNQASSSGSFSPNLALTQTSYAQATPDVIFQLVGTYTGTFQWHGSTSSLPMRLEITEQHTFDLSGMCLLGAQQTHLLKASVGTAFGGEEGPIKFTVELPASQGQQPFSLDFQGTVTKEGRMTGEVSASDGRTGTWEVRKG